MPQTDDRPLDPRSIAVDRLRGAIGAFLPALVSLVGAALYALTGSGPPLGALLLLAAWAAACAALATFVLLWPGVRYRHVSYRVSEQGLVIRRGVLWRTVHSLPRSRVQHTDVSQGPLERAFGLATLVVYTAGTAHASTVLSGLSHETAMRIRDHLIGGGTDDAV